MKSNVIKRSIIICGHKTSVSLEKEFWDGLCAIAEERGVSLGNMVKEIDDVRVKVATSKINLSSAIRLAVLADAKNKITA